MPRRVDGAPGTGFARGVRAQPFAAPADRGWSLAEAALAMVVFTCLTWLAVVMAIVMMRSAERAAQGADTVGEVLRLDRALTHAAARIDQPRTLTEPAVVTGTDSVAVGWLDGAPDRALTLVWSDAGVTLETCESERFAVRVHEVLLEFGPITTLTVRVGPIHGESRRTGPAPSFRIVVPLGRMPLP